MLLTDASEPPTCFLVAILLIYLSPVEMPAGQDGPISFISDPQTGLQPQVCLHLEKRSSHSFPGSEKANSYDHTWQPLLS